MKADKLIIGGKEFNSRLMVGTGKYDTMEQMAAAIEASGTEMVTVAVRRMNLQNPGEKSLLEYIDLKKITLLPNTAGATTVDEAVRFARLARAAGVSDFIKVEVFGDLDNLLPDPVATIETTRILAKEGFIVLPYTTDDPIVAKMLVEAGAAAVMPGASPIGSGQGFIDFTKIRMIIDRVNVPVVVDSGIGSPADAALSMEIGADAVLINTAIARAKDPALMAAAMKLGVEAGAMCFNAGRIPKTPYASPSSPYEGIPKDLVCY